MNAVATGLALLMAMIDPGPQPGGQHPVRLVSEREDGAVLLTVVGESAAAWTGDYTLEVTGGGPGARNRSVQRGSVSLHPRGRAVLVRIVLRDAAAGAWRATLHIRGTDGATYQEVATS